MHILLIRGIGLMPKRAGRVSTIYFIVHPRVTYGAIAVWTMAWVEGPTKMIEAGLQS